MFRVSLSAGVASAALFALASTTAHAIAHSDAAIGGITFTLIDLSPLDGTAPSFSLTAGGTTQLSVRATDLSPYETASASRTRAGTFSFSDELFFWLTNSLVSASIDGMNGLSASGMVDQGGFGYSATASTGGSYSLSLSANAALLITADVELGASAVNGTCSPLNYSCVPDRSSATGALSLSYSYTTADMTMSYNNTDSHSLRAISTAASQHHARRDEVKEFSGVLSATFTNMSQVTQTGSLRLYVTADGNTASMVPESSATAVAGAGLAVAAVVTRRGRRLC